MQPDKKQPKKGAGGEGSGAGAAAAGREFVRKVLAQSSLTPSGRRARIIFNIYLRRVNKKIMGKKHAET